MDSGDAPAPAGRNFEFGALAEARHYRAALFREFGPYLRGAVLEIGAGVGQFTQVLRGAADISRLLVLEPEPAFCHVLRRDFPDQWILRGTSRALLPDRSWTAIVSVNVLEHIEADTEELQVYHDLLIPTVGFLCLFVPARPEIYAPLDRDFGHFRRYTRSGLRAKLQQAGFRTARLHYFNGVGYAAWWVSFCLLKRRRFTPAAVRFFDRWIFPFAYGLESRFARPPLGQSLLAVGLAS